MSIDPTLLPTTRPRAQQSQGETVANDETERRLLDLLSQHLASTEKALEKVHMGMNNLAERIDVTSQRVFHLAVAILVVLAASSGANLWISYGGATVATGNAATSPVAGPTSPVGVGGAPTPPATPQAAPTGTDGG